jgi:flagellar motor switch protein FliG
MIEDQLVEFEQKLNSNKELVETALDLVDKVKRFFRLAKSIDEVYVNKVLADKTWQQNMDLLMTDQEKEIAYYIFNEIHKIVEYVESLQVEA